VVDAANVVGTRPDGWWNDRAGAARQLHEQLSLADLPHDEIVFVLEGDAKGGVAAGRDAHVRVVHARGNGDDVIVSQARTACERGDQVTVITADRALRARIEHVGARAMSPSWLLEQLT